MAGRERVRFDRALVSLDELPSFRLDTGAADGADVEAEPLRLVAARRPSLSGPEFAVCDDLPDGVDQGLIAGARKRVRSGNQIDMVQVLT